MLHTVFTNPMLMSATATTSIIMNLAILNSLMLNEISVCTINIYICSPGMQWSLRKRVSLTVAEAISKVSHQSPANDTVPLFWLYTVQARQLLFPVTIILRWHWKYTLLLKIFRRTWFDVGRIWIYDLIRI